MHALYPRSVDDTAKLIGREVERTREDACLFHGFYKFVVLCELSEQGGAQSDGLFLRRNSKIDVTWRIRLETNSILVETFVKCPSYQLAYSAIEISEECIVT